MGKSPINGGFSIAMFDYRRVRELEVIFIPLFPSCRQHQVATGGNSTCKSDPHSFKIWTEKIQKLQLQIQNIKMQKQWDCKLAEYHGDTMDISRFQSSYHWRPSSTPSFARNGVRRVKHPAHIRRFGSATDLEYANLVAEKTRSIFWGSPWVHPAILLFSCQAHSKWLWMVMDVQLQW